ncbi:P-loop containing nucleoside triphosphate hydrolase protein [Atractiella rhizophila]|nr:P-loop containing nucleoside triphosphate hydrolase protein [Atractiella rhizophila]
MTRSKKRKFHQTSDTPQQSANQIEFQGTPIEQSMVPGPSSKKSKKERDGNGLFLPSPFCDEKYIMSLWRHHQEPAKQWVENPKAVVNNFVTAIEGKGAEYKAMRGRVDGKAVTRCTISIETPVGAIQAIGDAESRKEAEKLCALSLCLQIGNRNLFDKSNLPNFLSAHHAQSNLTAFQKRNDNVATSPASSSKKQSGKANKTQEDMLRDVIAAIPKPATLTDGTAVSIETARQFMDFYCQKFKFGKPALVVVQGGRLIGGSQLWHASLSVGGSKIGMGKGKKKTEAVNAAYIDTAAYLERCDGPLWTEFQSAKKSLSGPVNTVYFNVSHDLAEELRELVYDASNSRLYERATRTRPLGGKDGKGEGERHGYRRAALVEGTPAFRRRGAELKDKLKKYLEDATMESMRAQRASLPISTNKEEVVKTINENDVSIVMAATGSGKTTQVPQLILDQAIADGKGPKCNIICTQPRRIAAISVGQRVAKERGELVGDTIGYQVRFEKRFPRGNGSVLFCTVGIFLKGVQDDEAGVGGRMMDGITHVVVDEVHERDVEIDLLLFVLRRALERRKKAGLPMFKIILMSATVDPTLFQNYFHGAPIIDVPGRTYPVERKYFDDVVADLRKVIPHNSPARWVWNDRAVTDYIDKEVANPSPNMKTLPTVDTPYAFIAIMISWIMGKSDSGHVLVFLPGWDEIRKVENMLKDQSEFPLIPGVNFNSDKYEIHLLHSSIPVADQQKVFDLPPEGVRRVILSTNIAETSVTIPDVCFVVDSGQMREKVYDPERRLSSLVTSFVGTSNLNQRAGRAGRHRPGEYYSLVSNARLATLNVHATVEMQREEISNVCMRILSFGLPMHVAEVLNDCIEPPEPERVLAALERLHRVGAIDSNEKLTSLGRVLVKLPVDPSIGKLCLLGSFFRCLEPTVTLATVFTNRDPFLAPINVRAEANEVKASWSPTDFKSDFLATLNAYKAWDRLQSTGQYVAANQFCQQNFLSKITLVALDLVKQHLIESLEDAGVLLVSGGTQENSRVIWNRRGPKPSATLPESLNTHSDSLPLLASLIATAVAPNFAIRASTKSWVTATDRVVIMSSSSVNHSKHQDDQARTSERQLYAFHEKVRMTATTRADGTRVEGPMTLRGTTALDPLGYMLFGANSLRVTERGLKCDDWLGIQGNVAALDDVERLREILDLCLLRVFEGLNSGPPAQNRPYRDDWEDENFREGEQDDDNPRLEREEVEDLDILATRVVRLLNRYAEERRGGSASLAGSSSRPQTPGGDYRGDSRAGSRAASPLLGARALSSTSTRPSSLAGSSRPPSSLGANRRPAVSTSSTFKSTSSKLGPDSSNWRARS